MRLMGVFTFCLFLLCVGCVFADNILVLIDNRAIEKSHSKFLASLKERGHTVDVKMADDSTLSLSHFGDFPYKHLVIFAPSVEEFGGSINVQEIIKFIDDGGGNVLIAAGANIGDGVRELVAEVGFEFDEDKNQVVDHENYDTKLDKGQHTTILASNTELIDAELITGPRSSIGPILYRGTAIIADMNNKLKLQVLSASKTATDGKKVDEKKSNSKENAVILVAAMQARNNARVVVAGSLDLFSDEFLDAQVNPKSGSLTKSGNFKFVTNLSKWVLKESGVLRVQYVKHSKAGETSPPEEYTIMDDVKYEIGIEELKNGKWVPFQRNDVQLEFVRIDPFVRTTLQNNGGHFTTTFKVSDVYGVFKFLVDYRRVGYTFLFDVQQVSVRPFTHTQYERFSRCAYPYYVSAFSMIIGVYVFSIVFLYHKDVDAKKSVSAAKTK